MHILNTILKKFKKKNKKIIIKIVSFHFLKKKTELYL